VTLHPIILSLTPPPEPGAHLRRTPLERFMSWMMMVAITWLFWLYDFIPGWPVAGLLVVACIGLLADLLGGTALPVYADVGLAISRFTDAFGTFFGRVYVGIETSLIWMAQSWRRPVMAAGLVSLLVFGLYFQHQLKVGDMTPGAALLYPGHPYNVAFSKVNEKFVGSSQLVVIAEGKKPEAIKDAKTLNDIDLFQRYMEQGPGAPGSSRRRHC